MKWWNSTTGEIELQMTLAQADSVSHSGDCLVEVMALYQDPSIKAQLDKYSIETIKEVVNEYTDWDDTEWKDELESGDFMIETIEDVYKIRLLWIAGSDISDNMDDNIPHFFPYI